jgi:transcriptional regulator with XRE-family HTH domain
VTRALDWTGYLNKLIYCYGCGRFGIPGKRGLPRGWRTLYQPHPDAPPGLHTCGDACNDKVRAAMAEGPVLEPLEIGKAPMMPAEIRDEMEKDAMDEMEKERKEAMAKERETAMAKLRAAISVPKPEDPADATLGDVLKTARLMKDMTLEDVEMSTEISAAFLGDVELGKRPIDADQAATLAQLFDLNFERLVELCHRWQHKFWNAQGVTSETEMKVGHVTTTSVEAAALRDTLVRLQSDLREGIALVESRLKGLNEIEIVDTATAHQWLARSKAAVAYTDTVLGIRPEKQKEE